jgi:putative transposase
MYLHLVYSTKNRERVIDDESRPVLHDYMGGILRNKGCVPVEINTEPDHAHVLFLFGRTVTVAEVVANLKQGSTLWLREQGPRYHMFQWQAGYGVFSVSHSNVEMVREYIRNQREHHLKMTFQDEFRAFLRKHGQECDERYVWD